MERESWFAASSREHNTRAFSRSQLQTALTAHGRAVDRGTRHQLWPWSSCLPSQRRSMESSTLPVSRGWPGPQRPSQSFTSSSATMLLFLSCPPRKHKKFFRSPWRPHSRRSRIFACPGRRYSQEVSQAHMLNRKLAKTKTKIVTLRDQLAESQMQKAEAERRVAETERRGHARVMPTTALLAPPGPGSGLTVTN